MADQTTIQLPSWDECSAALAAGRATALERFIEANEPAGKDDEHKFREQLAAVLEELANGRQNHPDAG